MKKGTIMDHWMKGIVGLGLSTLVAAGCAEDSGLDIVSLDPKIKLTSTQTGHSSNIEFVLIDDTTWVVQDGDGREICRDPGSGSRACPDELLVHATDTGEQIGGAAVLTATVRVTDETVGRRGGMEPHYSMIYWGEEGDCRPSLPASFQSIVEFTSDERSHGIPIYGSDEDEFSLRQWLLPESVQHVEIQTQREPTDRLVEETSPMGGRSSGLVISAAPPSDDGSVELGRMYTCEDEFLLFSLNGYGVIYTPSTIRGLDPEDSQRAGQLRVGFPTQAELELSTNLPSQTWIYDLEGYQTLTVASNREVVWDVRHPSAQPNRPVQAYTRGSPPTINRRWTLDVVPQSE